MGDTHSTTWNLWRRLMMPDGHPLYQRQSQVFDAGCGPSALWWGAPLLGVLGCCGLWTPLVRSQISFAALTSLALTMFSLGYVTVWTVRTSYAIAATRQRGTFDVYALAPSGALGAAWAICSAALHHRDAVGAITFFRQLTTAALTYILLVVLVVTMFNERVEDFQLLAGLLLDMLALAAVSYLEHIQSVVMGSLIGILTPIVFRSRFEAGLWAGAGFVALHGLTVAVSVGMQNTFPDGASLSPTLAGLLLFTLLREAIILILWRTLVRHLNGSLADLPRL